MPLIILHTLIAAPPNICFDCARNIDLHKRSMKDTGEQAIAGVQKGLIGLNETVTWKAT
ncbi:MAG: cell division protein, partial [Sphingobacteriales bacterium]